jgi:hypothetical protein
MLKAGRRFLGVAAGAAALTMALAPAASAHHCYKVDWNENAYANLAKGTAWMPLSDMAELFVAEFAPTCTGLGIGDDAVAAWMADSGTAQEPLVHTRTVVGGGAFHNAGKTPPPINYLSDADFVFLEEQLGTLIVEAGCAPAA